MRRMLTSILSIAVLSTIATTSAHAVMSDYEMHPGVQDFYEDYIVDHLEVGLRISHFTFKDPSEKTYDANGNLLGGYTAGISTYDLDEQQDYFPLPYLRYNIIPYAGIQLGWEHIKGDAMTLDEANPHSDGELTLSGPSMMVYGRYPISIFSPYIGVGLAFLSGKFEEESGWYANGLRAIDADGTTGYLVTIGTSAEVYEGIELDVAFSSLSADSDATYSYNGQERTSWTFPCDSWIFQAGVKYAF